MRAGWVDMISTRGGTEFDATPLGRIQAKADDLPAFPLVQHRWLGFNIDQVTGTVFRGRELRLVHQNDLAPDAIRLGASELHATGDMGDVFATLEGDDEVIVGVESFAREVVAAVCTGERKGFAKDRGAALPRAASNSGSHT